MIFVIRFMWTMSVPMRYGRPGLIGMAVTPSELNCGLEIALKLVCSVGTVRRCKIACQSSRDMHV
jgi:hypothetical protein